MKMRRRSYKRRMDVFALLVVRYITVLIIRYITLQLLGILPFYLLGILPCSY